MTLTLTVENLSTSGQASITVVSYPDICPICHCAIVPIFVQGVLYYPTQSGLGYDAQLVFRCTRRNCSCLFIGYYSKPDVSNYYELKGRWPYIPKKESFSDIIKSVSANFCTIYNEASLAEQYGLHNICGTAYRKALEFLIKDYVLRDKQKKEKEKMAGIFLGTFISNYITNPNIQEVAKRAAWLGNDETHYLRIWTDKDVHDLKLLIQLTVRWIETEELTKEAVKEMPEGKKCK